MPKNILFFSVIILFSSTFTSCQIDHKGSPLSEQGSISKDIVIEKYIAALQKGDKKSIENMVPQGLDAKRGIADKIDLYQNKTLEVQKICYEFGDKTSIVSASIFGGLTVNATGKKKSFTERITLIGQSGGWFLGLGTPKAVTRTNHEKTTAPEPKPQ